MPECLSPDRELVTLGEGGMVNMHEEERSPQGRVEVSAIQTCKQEKGEESLDCVESMEASSAPAASPETKMCSLGMQQARSLSGRSVSGANRRGADPVRERLQELETELYTSTSSAREVTPIRDNFDEGEGEPNQSNLRPTSGKIAAYPCEPHKSATSLELTSKSTLDQRVIAGVLVGEK